MPCDIKRLTKDELNVFIHGIPKKAYKLFGPKKVLPKGFGNIEKVPDSMLFNNIKRLLGSDRTFVMNFNKFLDGQLELTQKKTKKLEDQGYDHISAYAKVIEQDFNEEYRSLFLKVFGESEEVIKAILRSIEESGALEAKIRVTVKSMLPGPDARVDALAKEIKRLDEEMAKLTKAQKDAINERKSIKAELEKQFQEEISKRISAMEQELTSLSSSLKKTISDLEKKVASQGKQQPTTPAKDIKEIKDQLETLTNQLKAFEEAFAELPSRTVTTSEQPKVSTFDVTIIPGPTDFDLSDEEYLGDNIIDVAMERIRQEAADVYRQALLEYIYQAKPIIAAGKAAIHIVEEISGVLTGGTYHKVKLNERSFDFGDLLDVLGRISPKTEPFVVLIEGILGKGDLNPLIRRMRDVVPNARIVLSLPETRFVKFLDPSLFEQCLYFGGKFIEAESSYLYATTITPKGLKPNEKYLAVKETLGLGSTFSSSMVGTDCSGLAAYCLIPYLIDHEQMILHDVLARINDDNLRKKCKEALNA